MAVVDLTCGCCRQVATVGTYGRCCQQSHFMSTVDVIVVQRKIIHDNSNLGFHSSNLQLPFE